MTTTLRPAGPEEHREAAGARGAPSSRSYDICDNGRRVGAVEAGVHDRFGVRTGRIAGLAVDAADRRRGRATVAVLAAEEVLRGWGCRRVTAAVPAAAGPALRLAAALGYTEHSRHLLKELVPPGPHGAAGGPAAADGGVLHPMTDDHYGDWLSRDRAQLASGMTAEGVPPGQAAEAAEHAQRALLPDGPATPGMGLYRLLHRHTDVGTLWLRLDGAPRPDADAWVYAVEVFERHRGHGHGRTLMRAAEKVCHAAGARTLGLNVHIGNSAARALYDALGYRPVEYLLGKPLN